MQNRAYLNLTILFILTTIVDFSVEDELVIKLLVQTDNSAKKLLKVCHNQEWTIGGLKN